MKYILWKFTVMYHFLVLFVITHLYIGWYMEHKMSLPYHILDYIMIFSHHYLSKISLLMTKYFEPKLAKHFLFKYSCNLCDEQLLGWKTFIDNIFHIMYETPYLSLALLPSDIVYSMDSLIVTSIFYIFILWNTIKIFIKTFNHIWNELKIGFQDYI